MPHDGSPSGSQITFRDLAELQAAFKADLAATEARLASEIKAHGSDSKELEDRLRAAENAIVQLKTVGALIMSASSLLSVGLGAAGLIYSIWHG